MSLGRNVPKPGLINNILDLSKIEAGKMDVFIEAVDIQALVKEVLSIVKPLADKSENVIEVICPADIGSFHSDQTKITLLVKEQVDPLRVKLLEEFKEIHERTPKSIDRPCCHHVDLAARYRLHQSIEPRPGVTNLGARGPRRRSLQRRCWRAQRARRAGGGSAWRRWRSRSARASSWSTIMGWSGSSAPSMRLRKPPRDRATTGAGSSLPTV